MNEKQKEMLEKILKRLDLVMIGVLGSLLGLVVLMMIQEQGYTIEEVTAPSPRPWEVKLPSPQYDKVVAHMLQVQSDINKDEKVRRAVRNNMFDVKSAREATEAAKVSNEEFNRAERLFQEKKYQEAATIVDGTLARDPNHRPSQDLKKRLDAVLNPPKTGSTATPTPAA